LVSVPIGLKTTVIKVPCSQLPEKLERVCISGGTAGEEVPSPASGLTTPDVKFTVRKHPALVTPIDARTWQAELEARGLAAATVYAVASRVSSSYTWAMEDPDGNIAGQRDLAMRLFYLLTGMRRREAEPGERRRLTHG
jgi:hypothetical protein